MIPKINWNKCDGCGICVEICPENVLELQELSQENYKKLKWHGKLKAKAKGNLRSNVINEFDCIGCEICVDNCHEKAIKLL